MTRTRGDHESQDELEQPELEVMTDEQPQPTSLVFRTPIPNTADAPQEEIERGEGKWAGGCFFTDAETQQRTWVPDANLICVRVS